MRTGFDLNDWISIHMHKLMPVTNLSDGSVETLSERYERFSSKILTGDSDNVKKYRRQLFGAGAELIAFLPQRFVELSIALEKVTLAEWESFSLYTRGEILAHIRISNMRDVLTRHLEIQATEKEKRESGKSNAS